MQIETIEKIVQWPLMLFVAIMASACIELWLGLILQVNHDKLIQSAESKVKTTAILFVLWWFSLYFL